LPRGLRDPAHLPLLLLLLAAIGVALAQPISNQIDAFQHNVPHLVDEANKRLDSVQKFFNHHGIHIQLEKQGQTALDTIQDKVLKGSSSLLSFTTSLLKSAADAAFALVLIFVMSVYLLVYARQIGRARAPLLPRRRRHAGRRLPDARAARRRRLRARAAALQRRDGHDRRRRAVALRRARHLPRRAHLRLRLRRVLRRDGARAVRRPGARRDPAGRRRAVPEPAESRSGWCCCSS
jgi:hypothetical protein